MMALSEIKDTTGSKLNQYKITHADGTTEVVTLEFSPGDDYVPGTPDVRTGSASTTGRLCVIGSHIQEDALAALFRTC